MRNIEKLNPEDMGSSRLVNTGLEEELSPKPTEYNMLLLMKKINELIESNNDLRSRLTAVEGAVQKRLRLNWALG